MSNRTRIDYDRAEEDLWDQTDSEEPFGIRDYRNEKEFRSYMNEHGLNPDKYIKNGNGGKSGGDDPLCFLTTACIRAKALPDDCDELRTLRAFRDGYLRSLPEGEDEIKEYYRIAPRIVADVSALPDAQERWVALYGSLVLPCVRWIIEGKNEEAHRLYRQTVLNLKKEFSLT